MTFGKDQRTPGKTGDAGKDQMVPLGWQPWFHTKNATKPNKERCPQDSPKGGENDESIGAFTESETLVQGTHESDQRVDFPCVCGRTFSTQRGMKIHRTKKGCASRPVPETQRTAQAGETSEIQSQDTIHSAEEIRADGPQDGSTQPKRPRIKFPAANEKDTWKELDKTLVGALKARLAKSTFQHRLSKFGDVLYEICSQEFGVREAKPKPLVKKNRRQVKMEELRRQKKGIKRQMRTASEAEKRGLLEVWKQLKAQHSALSKAERLRRQKRARRMEQERFFRDPYQYARELFDQPRSGTLRVEQKTLEDHLEKTYSDPNRNIPLGQNIGLVWPDVPGKKFTMKPPSLEETRRVVQKAKCKSAPGPNGIPYLLFKRCPGVLGWLHSQLRQAWLKGHVNEEWRKAEGVYIAKEQNSTELGQFRPISLLNVEGKIFFSIIAQRLTSFLMENGYIDTSVQKGGVPGIAGCLEHATMIWESIQLAKSGRRNLDVVWLDLANAYGSVPHSMIQLALDMYHVPDQIKAVLKEYFAGFQMRFTTETYTTKWIDLQVGIAMGCAVSPILFVMAMQVLLKATESKAPPADLGGGCFMPPLKAFMDDTTVVASKESDTHTVLKRLDELIAWSRMKFKPKKSRSLSLRKGKVSKEVHFHISDQKIPTVSEVPVKSLGRWYDDSLKDTNRVKEIRDTLESGLKAIDRRPLAGKHKIWCLQHMLIPKLLWPLLIYEISLTTVEALEAKINRFTRKWLGVPPCLTDVALYGRQAKLRLPFKSITEEYKCGKTRLAVMLETSEDDVVKAVQPTLKTGRKWKVLDVVSEAKESLKLKEIIGHTQSGRQGLGSQPMKWWSKAGKKEGRDMIIQEVRSDEDQKRYQKAVQQSLQGQWTTWDDALQRSLTWNDLWNMAPLRLNFIVRSTYDLLPSGANLARWGKTDDPKCPLCHKLQTTEHVLSSCSKSLAEGRYTWRHNRVLEKLAETIIDALPQSDTETCSKKQPQRFVREKSGDAYKYARHFAGETKGATLLSGATDWVVAGDLPQLGPYPHAVKKSGQRPDIVLYSEILLKMILVELTVPYESRIEERHQYKLAKYDDLASQVRSAGYAARVMAVEVGARGFVGASVFNLLTQLGIRGRKRTRTMKELSEVAEKSSSWLWSRRNESRLMNQRV